MKKSHTRIWLEIVIFVIMFAVFLVLFRTPGCDPNLMTEPYVFIATAFDTEMDAILERVGEVEACMHAGITYRVAEYGEQDIILFMTGVGPERALKTTEKVLANMSVELLIFSGVAGAVDSSLAVGETVVAREWLELESGKTNVLYKDLVDLAQNMDKVTIVDTGVTTAHFVSDTNNLPEHVSIVDMETAAVVAVAEQYQVPFIAFRSISDMSDGEDNDEGFWTAATASADVVLRFVDVYSTVK